MKIRPVGTELFMLVGRQTDRRTDIKRLMVALRNFTNAHKILNNQSVPRSKHTPSRLQSQSVFTVQET
jgi:hypothetical protein